MPGHKANQSKKDQRVRFKNRHPEGRKNFSKAKRAVRLKKRLERLDRQRRKEYAEGNEETKPKAVSNL